MHRDTINKILLARKYQAFGDWLMLATLIKHINRQYPHIIVDVDVSSVPVQLLQFVAWFDIRATPVAQPDLPAYDVYFPHVVYEYHKRYEHHLIEDLVRIFNEGSGLHVVYDPTCLAQYIGPYTTKITGVPDDGFIIIAPENGPTELSKPKDWGWDNFERLAERLSKHKHTQVVQIGTNNSATLKYAGQRFANMTLGPMLKLMRMSRAVVTLENGISHFAGHHAIPAYTIYMPAAPHARPSNTHYPKQVAIFQEYTDPDWLADKIIADTGLPVEKVI
jgi:ADP-heptose:LPS heptosyltransferase